MNSKAKERIEKLHKLHAMRTSGKLINTTLRNF